MSEKKTYVMKYGSSTYDLVRGMVLLHEEPKIDIIEELPYERVLVETTENVMNVVRDENVFEDIHIEGSSKHFWEKWV